MVLPSAAPPVVRQPAFQAGIDVDWYAWRGEDVLTGAERVAVYARSLHANSVAISFPFFTDVATSQVYATSATPTPAMLAQAVDTLEGQGLWVTLRPLLDEQNLRPLTRPHWVPANRYAWFASYRTFLRPYAAMAQANHVGQFDVGAELVLFQDAPGWALVDQQVGAVYHGQLGYAGNFTGPTAGGGGAGVVNSMDAYRPIPAPYQTGWDAYVTMLVQQNPHDVLSEVGIAAAAPAATAPWTSRWPVTSLDVSVQTEWDAAACQAATTEGAGGIYFWSIGLGTPPTQPSLSDQWTWAPTTVQAISSCFAEVST
jgi:hypothetical protein